MQQQVQIWQKWTSIYQWNMILLSVTKNRSVREEVMYLSKTYLIMNVGPTFPYSLETNLITPVQHDFAPCHHHYHFCGKIVLLHRFSHQCRGYIKDSLFFGSVFSPINSISSSGLSISLTLYFYYYIIHISG